MRRSLIIGTALAVLAAAATASAAAFNSYTGSGLALSPKGSGTPAQPKAVNMAQTLHANAPAGDRAVPLKNITLRVYGVRTNGNLFPTCTDSQIMANTVKYELACAPKSRIAQGPVHSLLGPPNDPSQAKGIPCNPWLKEFNGGRSTQVLFFTTTTHTPDPSKYTCAGLPTGTTAPYDGHISYQGKWWVLNIPLPADISTDVVGQYGSLITEVLSPISETTSIGGKTRGYMESVACQGHKRPWSITFTSQDYNSTAHETQTVSGSSAC